MTKFVPVFVSSGLRARRIAISNSRFRRTALTSGPSFELRYQARVAIDRIRFAIRQGETVAPEHPVLVGTRMQLLDALDRLESAERHFQTLPRKVVFVRTVPFMTECRIMTAGINNGMSWTSRTTSIDVM